MPRKETDTVDSKDAGHTVARCQQALGGMHPSAIYTAYWEQQLHYAEQRETKERQSRSADA